MKPKYAVRLRRDKWSKRVAQKHMRDVSSDTRFTNHYDEFSIEEA